VSRGDVLTRLGAAPRRGDREAARAIYYAHPLPNGDFGHREADRTRVPAAGP
jgi:hypothetical protein